MAFKQIKNSYNAGELSEYMTGRTDIGKYHNGASRMINATVLPHGGFVKRGGSEFIGKSPNKAKLFPFEFSVADSLILEFSNLLIRFYKDGDRVYETAVDILSSTEDNPVEITTDGAHSYTTGEWVLIEGISTATSLNDKIYQITVIDPDEFSLQDTEGNDIDGTGIGVGSGGTAKRIFQIVSPYTSAQAFKMHVTQSADVMYIAHPDIHPQKLIRAGDTDWTIADVGFIGGPFLDENTTTGQTLQFTTAAAHDGGGAQNLTLTDTSQAWVINEFVGRTIHNITTGANAIISSNTATTITHAALSAGNWTDADTYNIDGYFPVGSEGTLEATGHTPFLGTTNDIGTLWLLKTTRTDNTTSTFDSDTNATPTDLVNAVRTKGDYTVVFDTFSAGDVAKLWRKEGIADWQEFRSFSGAVSFSATEDENDTYYAITRSVNTINGTFTAKNQTNSGIVKVTAQSDTNTATVVVVSEVQQSQPIGDGAVATSVDTLIWAEGAWGLFRGYPRTLTFFEDRLWWASSANNPDTLWGSKSSLYENMEFSDLALDDDAVVFPINDNEVSQIQWMMARQVMAIGAANKEYRFGANDPDKPVTPSDRKATPQTGIGSGTIQPVMLNDAIFFFQRQGRKLWAMQFDAITENFDSDDVTLLANTLLESAPTCMAVQRVPDSIIWVTRTDGVLLTFTYEPKEEVAGWARQITQNTVSTKTPTGFYESVAVIHGSTEDEVWVSVRRVIDGVTVRYVEKFATRLFDEIDEALMLDSAVIVASAFSAQDIVLASDTVRCNNGLCNSSRCGGVTS